MLLIISATSGTPWEGNILFLDCLNKYTYMNMKFCLIDIDLICW